MDDVNISYVKHGFTHSFSAIYDALLCCWSIHMLVLHCKVKNKLYLGEYYEFYRYVRRRIWKMEHLNKKQELLEALETRYNSVIQAYLEQFVFTIHKSCTDTTLLYDYAQRAIEGIHQIINLYHLDLTITRIYQPKSVMYYFTRKDQIVASYAIYKGGTDHLNFQY